VEVASISSHASHSTEGNDDSELMQSAAAMVQKHVAEEGWPAFGVAAGGCEALWRLFEHSKGTSNGHSTLGSLVSPITGGSPSSSARPTRNSSTHMTPTDESTTTLLGARPPLLLLIAGGDGDDGMPPSSRRVVVELARSAASATALVKLRSTFLLAPDKTSGEPRACAAVLLPVLLLLWATCFQPGGSLPCSRSITSCVWLWPGGTTGIGPTSVKADGGVGDPVSAANMMTSSRAYEMRCRTDSPTAVRPVAHDRDPSGMSMKLNPRKIGKPVAAKTEWTVETTARHTSSRQGGEAPEVVSLLVWRRCMPVAVAATASREIAWATIPVQKSLLT